MSKRIASPQDLIALKEKAKADLAIRSGAKDIQITVHMGTCGIAAGARDVLASLVSELQSTRVDTVTVKQSGCAGLCDREPMLTLTDASGHQFRYGKLDSHGVHKIIQQHVVGGTPVLDLIVSK